MQRYIYINTYITVSNILVTKEYYIVTNIIHTHTHTHTHTHIYIYIYIYCFNKQFYYFKYVVGIGYYFTKPIAIDCK